MSLSDEDLAAIQARAEAVGVNEWVCDGFADGDNIHLSIYAGRNQRPPILTGIESQDLAHLLMEDAPALLSEVRELRATLDRVRDVADDLALTPKYANSDYERGRHDQQRVSETDLRSALEGTE